VSANTKNVDSGSEYNDAYETYSATYATFRAYTGEVEPDEVSRLLGMKPTGSVTQGKMIVTGPSKGKISKLNGWFPVRWMRAASACASVTYMPT
jgi:hypothetical protein